MIIEQEGVSLYKECKDIPTDNRIRDVSVDMDPLTQEV